MYRRRRSARGYGVLDYGSIRRWTGLPATSQSVYISVMELLINCHFSQLSPVAGLSLLDMVCITSLRGSPLAPGNHHHQEEVEGLFRLETLAWAGARHLHNESDRAVGRRRDICMDNISTGVRKVIKTGVAGGSRQTGRIYEAH